MPVYSYCCPSCFHTFDVVKKLAQLDRVEECPLCADNAERRIVAPHIAGDYEAYNCPITGKRVEGRREHQENLKKNGCRVLEPGEREQFLQRKAQEQKEQEKEIDNWVEQAAAQSGLIH
jgi:putative FmdB family regulatory protein